MKVTRASRPRGIILIAVLVAVAMLSFAAYTSFHWLSVETDTTLALSDQTQARYLAESGVALVEQWERLRQAGRNVPEMGNDAGLFKGITVPLSTQAASASTTPTREGRFTIWTGKLAETGSTNLASDKSTVRFGVLSEGARLHLNHWFALDPAALERTLLEWPGATKEAVHSLLDWLDEDDAPRENGAESEYYRECNPPIIARNGPIESIDELLLVRGITPELLFGEDANRNGRLDDGENDGAASSPADNEDNVLDEGWSVRLTLWSRETNRDSKGRPRIDLNQPDLGLLYSAIRREFGTDWAKYVVARRVLLAAAPAAANPPGGPPVSGRIESVWDLVDARARGTFEKKKFDFPSPLVSTSESFAMDLTRALDRFTVRGEAVMNGRIDVLSAPADVLAIVGLIPPELRERIIKERPAAEMSRDRARSLSSEPSKPTTLAWLATESLLDIETLRRVDGFLSATSSTRRFQTVGYFDEGRTAYRMELLWDGCAAPPRGIWTRRKDRWGNGTPLMELGQGSEPGALPEIGESSTGSPSSSP